MAFHVLGLDPGKTTGYFLCRGYESLAWGSERDVSRIIAEVPKVDVVVYEDALDLDQIQPLRNLLHVPWVGVTPEQLQRRLFSRVLGRKQFQGPLARREIARRAFGAPPGDVHALDAACLCAWWLLGSEVATGAPDLGILKVWDWFTIKESDQEESYQVVPPNTADPSAGMISWLSPLAQAVAVAKPGDRVTVQAPGGAWECTFVRVEAWDQ